MFLSAVTLFIYADGKVTKWKGDEASYLFSVIIDDLHARNDENVRIFSLFM